MNSALSFSHENQLERCAQVSVRRIFCYSRGELVFFLAWHERSFFLSSDFPQYLSSLT